MTDRTSTRQAVRLGMQLRSRRKALGLTQSEVAELAGTTQRTVSLLESGKPTARLDIIAAVSDTLGLELVAVSRERLAEIVGSESAP